MPFIHVLPNSAPYAKYILVDLAGHQELQKDAIDTAKLFSALLNGKISYQIVNQIPEAQEGQVLHLIGVPSAIKNPEAMQQADSKKLLLEVAADLRNISLLELESGNYRNGEIPSKSKNAYISPCDLHKLVAPYGYTDAELDEGFAEDSFGAQVADVVQPQPKVLREQVVPAWITIHYSNARAIRYTGSNQQYLMVEADIKLTFPELMCQLLDGKIDISKVSLINQAKCLAALQADEAVVGQHIIPIDKRIGFSGTLKPRAIFLGVAHWFKEQEVDRLKDFKAEEYNWRASGAYKYATQLSEVLVSQNHPPAIFDHLADLIYGKLLYDGVIVKQSGDIKTGNEVTFDLIRQAKLISAVKAIFNNSHAEAIEYINETYLNLRLPVAINSNYEASLTPNLNFHVSNGAHAEWGERGITRFYGGVSKAKYSFVVQAGFDNIYSSSCSFKDTYWPADWTNYLTHLKEKKFPVMLMKKAGRFILYKATVSEREQWIMTAAIEDDAAHGFAKRDHEARTLDFTQVTDGFSQLELQLLWNYGSAMVEKSANEAANALLHCHAGRNRSPALMAILYFICLLQQKNKQGLSIEEITTQLGKAEDQTLEDKLNTEFEKLRQLVGPKKIPFVNAGWLAQVKNTWKNFITNFAEFTAGNAIENIFSITAPDEFAVKTDKLLSILQVEIDVAMQALGGAGVLIMFNTLPGCYKDFFDELRKIDDIDDTVSKPQAAFAKYLILTDFKKQVRQAGDVKKLDEIIAAVLKHKLLASKNLHTALKILKPEQQNPPQEQVSILAGSLSGVLNPVASAGSLAAVVVVPKLPSPML